MATYLRTGRHEKLPTGGAHNTKVDEEMRDELERLLDVNPLLTLTQMKDELQRGVSWPSGLAYRTQVLVLAAECGFESRP